MESLLFPVGLFHPLQHAGLSRRTAVPVRSPDNQPHNQGGHLMIISFTPLLLRRNRSWTRAPRLARLSVGRLAQASSTGRAGSLASRDSPGISFYRAIPEGIEILKVVHAARALEALLKVAW